jgi:hypothetical protein
MRNFLGCRYMGLRAFERRERATTIDPTSNLVHKGPSSPCSVFMWGRQYGGVLCRNGQDVSVDYDSKERGHYRRWEQ